MRVGAYIDACAEEIGPRTPVRRRPAIPLRRPAAAVVDMREGRTTVIAIWQADLDQHRELLIRVLRSNRGKT